MLAFLLIKPKVHECYWQLVAHLKTGNLCHDMTGALYIRGCCTKGFKHPAVVTHKNLAVCKIMEAMCTQKNPATRPQHISNKTCGNAAFLDFF